MRNKNTLFIGKVVHAFEQLPSTNLYAQELLSKSAPSEGTAITAAYQTAGRGQLGSSWSSEAGSSLLMSVIFYPHFLSPRQQHWLNMLAALAIRDAVQAFVSAPVLIKWPNDIYLQGKKAAGILLQNSISSQRIQHCIAGLGINVNQQEFPESLPQATSLYLAEGHPQSVAELQQAVFEKLEQYYLRLKGHPSRGWLQEAYYGHLLGYQEIQHYQEPGGDPFPARLLGLDEHGRLLLQSGGQVKAYGIKEIARLP